MTMVLRMLTLKPRPTENERVDVIGLAGLKWAVVYTGGEKNQVIATFASATSAENFMNNMCSHGVHEIREIA